MSAVKSSFGVPADLVEQIFRFFLTLITADKSDENNTTYSVGITLLALPPGSPAFKKKCKCELFLSTAQ